MVNSKTKWLIALYKDYEQCKALGMVTKVNDHYLVPFPYDKKDLYIPYNCDSHFVMNKKDFAHIRGEFHYD